MKKHFSSILNTKKGFTLFIALIVSSILLAVGFSIGNIILKQLQLSTAGRESQIAFYAADSAAECALYWDRKNPDGESVVDLAFGTTTPDLPTFIKCGTGTDGLGAVHIAGKIPDGTGMNATTTFYIDYTDATGYGYNSCAKVMVGKNGNNTTIDARGYNAPYSTAMNACDTTGLRTVERGLLLLY